MMRTIRRIRVPWNRAVIAASVVVLAAISWARDEAETPRGSAQVTMGQPSGTGGANALQTNRPKANPLPKMLEKTPPPTRTVPGEIAIKFKRGSKFYQSLEARGRRELTSGEIKDWLPQSGIKKLQPAFKHGFKNKASARIGLLPSGSAQRKQQEEERERLRQWYHITFDSSVDVQASIQTLKSSPDVEYVEPVYEYHTAQVIPPPITDLPDGTTDPLLPDQWHHTATHVQQAWNYLKESGSHPGGDRDVVVAVIDSGVDYTHEELVGNMWTNSGEIPGNGIDDDNDGFVDDVYGCSVVSDPRSHHGNPIDINGHGTHVAGIIAATAYNHLGGAGVAFNVRIMAVRAAQYAGVLTTTDISEGILYAVDHGAEVINMSFGGYGYSQIVADALGVALHQAVLVAAAGNDNTDVPMFPAALHYVLGVMAHDPAYQKTWFSNYGPNPIKGPSWRSPIAQYEILAPGEGIWSTLPHNNYAAWSGTSMATPVASGVAALMRSYFKERDIYSSRFIMGSMAANGKPLTAYGALTTPPKPGVSMLENWLFDSKSIDPQNDGDGRLDSGETIHLGIEVINRSGMASGVFALLEATNDYSGEPDPCVAITTPIVQFGNIGPFNTADNGFIYDSNGVITGFSDPFVFQISPTCDNDHVIPFVMTIVWWNGWDPEDTDFYTSVERFYYTVQRGRDLPRVISENMQLTAQDYWFVGGPILIEEGATVTVGPGTQIQWGGISDDPYNPGPQPGSIVVRGTLLIQGSADQPVNLFPSTLVAGQTTKIAVESGGVFDMAYVKVRNPELTGLRTIDHAYFDWENYPSKIRAERISNSIFHRLLGGGDIASGSFDTCLFDAGWLSPQFLRDYYPAAGISYYTKTLYNSAFLQDNENNHPMQLQAGTSFTMNLPAENVATTPPSNGFIHDVVYSNGRTYAILDLERMSLQLAETIANYLGGHVASILDSDQQQALTSYLAGVQFVNAEYYNRDGHYYIGLSDNERAGEYHWTDGQPLSYTHWASGYPFAHLPGLYNIVEFAYKGGGPHPFTDGDWRNVGETGYSIPYQYWSGFVLTFSGQRSQADLNAALLNPALLDFVRANYRDRMRFNAFLSKNWDPNITHWMRILGVPKSPYDDYARKYISTMYDNYWGTASTTLIDYLIYDYYDDFTSSRIDYKPPAPVGYASTYPFVESVLIDGVDATSIPTLASGYATFTVKFNRDMDTSVVPFATFGPSPPHTDYELHPVSGTGWVDARTWEGTLYITPVVGDGYHLMRISGAVAAGDPWLVSGYDVGRFRFKVATMQTESMNLQATGGEGHIQLSWQQNDYELLAGYNLYRASSMDGEYTLLNETIIPPGSESYRDTQVTPAVPMYYKFTVVATDMNESAFSNVASATPVDTIAPQITHTPVVSAAPGSSPRITAQITDNAHVASATLYYRTAGAADYIALAMTNVSGNDWSATIPASAVLAPGVDYYLAASDGINQTLFGAPLTPYRITVSASPAITSIVPNHGPATGGTNVTISGALFGQGATVLFGTAPASNVVVISGNQISCTTPPHYPMTVNVQVVNTDSSTATLAGGFSFEATGTVLSLPQASGIYGSTVDVGIAAANVEGLAAADITIAFDPAVLSVQSARTGPLAAGWSLAWNQINPGTVKLSLANSTSVTGSGILAYVSFEVIQQPPASSALIITNALLNDGAIARELSNGLFTVTGFHTVSGQVLYFNGGAPVPGTTLTLAGNGSFASASDEAGNFSLGNIPTGTYVLTPSKNDGVVGITALDASMVLQHAVGMITLTGPASIAADVNKNGSISSMDASHILQKAVDLINVPFPGTTKVWDFDPAKRDYGTLNGNLSGQDFTGILLGDVTGNWQEASGGEAAGASLQSIEDPAVVSLPEHRVVAGGQATVALTLAPGDESVHSADVRIGYDPNVVSPVSVSPGSLASGWMMASNLTTPGVIKVAMANSQGLSAEGDLLQITFQAVGAAGGNSPLTLSTADLDEGQVEATLQSGRLIVVAHEYALTVTVNGKGSVSSSPLGIDCAFGSCTTNFAEETMVVLKAKPGTGRIFKGWTGACTGSGDCVVPMTEARAATAIFGKSVAADFDGNGVMDVAVWRPETGMWYITSFQSPGTYAEIQWGMNGDNPVPADYDGDGKADVAVWRPADGMWYILPSKAPGTYTATQWGMAGDVPVPADYDDDGKADVAVWRPDSGTWYIRPSSAPESYTSSQWGIPTDIPVPADYDADGKDDIAVWRPLTGEWYVLTSSEAGSVLSRQWGIPTDIPVPGDYDGDGKADIAVWRPDSGTWFGLPSHTPGSITMVQWGMHQDVPTAGDFDGDGKGDVAVWRPADGTWYVIPSSAPQTYMSTQWGVGTDVSISAVTGIMRSIP